MIPFLMHGEHMAGRPVLCMHDTPVLATCINLEFIFLFFFLKKKGNRSNAECMFPHVSLRNTLSSLAVVANGHASSLITFPELPYTAEHLSMMSNAVCGGGRRPAPPNPTQPPPWQAVESSRSLQVAVRCS